MTNCSYYDIEILYEDVNDVSESIDFNKTNDLPEYEICHYSFRINFFINFSVNSLCCLG